MTDLDKLPYDIQVKYYKRQRHEKNLRKKQERRSLENHKLV